MGEKPKGQIGITFYEAAERIRGSDLSKRAKRKELERIAARYLQIDGARIIEGGIVGNHEVGKREIALKFVAGKPNLNVYGPGRHFAFPWISHFERYSIEPQWLDVTLSTVTNRMLRCEIDVHIVHRLKLDDPGRLAEMLYVYGENYVKLIPDYLIAGANEITIMKTDEEVMGPSFTNELTQKLRDAISDLGVDVIVNVTDRRMSPAITKRYGDLTDLETEGFRMQARISLMETRARLAMREFALRSRLNIAEARVNALVERVMGEVKTNLERQRRQVDYLTEAHFRELLIKAGGAAIFADKLPELAAILAHAIAERVKGKQD